MSISSSSSVLLLHETKGDPVAAPLTKISEAFGSEKCPQLLLQCRSEESEIRQRALAVLCEELRNPLSVVACLRGSRAEENKALQTLSKSLGRTDFLSRVRAAEALFEVSKDGNGIGAMLLEPGLSIVLPALLKAARDDSKQIKYFVFGTMANLADTPDGARVLVKFGAPAELLRYLTGRIDRLKGSSAIADRSEDGRLDDSATAAVLRAVYGLCGLQDGLSACLPTVQLSVALLNTETGTAPPPLITLSPLSDDVLVSDGAIAAARLLSLLCFSSKGADLAVKACAIEALVLMLRHITVILTSVSNGQGMKRSTVNFEDTPAGAQLKRSNLATISALAACTCSDEAKQRFLPCEGSIDALCMLLSSTDGATKLAALKAVSNCAVHPETRLALRQHPLCLRSIRALLADNGGITDRHARVAEQAVLWEA